VRSGPTRVGFGQFERLRDSIADTASSIVRMTIVRGCLQASHSGQPKVIPECIERQVTSACSVSLSHGIGEGAGPTHPTIDSVAGSAGIPRKRLSGLTCTPQCAPRGKTCLAAFIGDSHALMSDNRCGCDSQRAVASIGQGQARLGGRGSFHPTAARTAVPARARQSLLGTAAWALSRTLQRSARIITEALGRD
jgi:hypothetical protein